MGKIAMIAAAGRGSRMLSLTENNPKAMLPFNCKPIIGHHLDYLIEEGFSEVVIIVGYKKEKLIDYVNTFYGNKIDIRFSEQTELNGLAGAIHNGLRVLDDWEMANSSLLILLGDIVLTKKLESYDYDFIGYDIVEDWSRWCMIEEENGEIIKFIDKPDSKPNTNKNVMGVYNITEIEALEAALRDVIEHHGKIRNEFQLSQALDLYLEYSSCGLTAIHIPDYLDLGDLDALNKTRQNITRHFNSITPTDRNTIIKSSSNSGKMYQEASWFQNISRELLPFTPHLVSSKKDSYELEFIHSNPLQELYLFNLPEAHEWKNIFKTIKRFIDTAKESVTFQFAIPNSNEEIIVDKTVKRVEEIKDYDFIQPAFISINSILYKNPVKHIEKLMKTAKTMFVNDDTRRHFSYLHGDLFFGNMLYDVNTNVLKVIDPRGEYGDFRVHGDIRYDIAKLNHSINGYYDFIVNGLYFLEERDGKYYYNFYESKQKDVQEIFKETILKDYNEKEIKLLTGLLFLSMIPLHSENLNNQKMQFIKAVEFLNEFI